jgi:predicted AlkP superfamily pyrophosphatase or phosphodiesterase
MITPLLAVLCLAFQTSPAPEPALLMVSIDGLRPDNVLEDRYHVRIPRLRAILRQGAHARGVRGVLPTVTYPSHTTLLTGVWPDKHGIYANHTFDPLARNLDGWLWYSEDIRAPTLWEVAAQAGMEVGSVSWPVSVGAPGVKYLVPEYFRAPKFQEDDEKLVRALSTPAGMMAEIAKTAGPYINDLDEAEAGDRQRTRYAEAIIRTKHPRLMTVHLASLDHLQHAGGPFSADSSATLEKVDGELGELEDAMKTAFPDAVICVVSDHGFARTDHSLNLMAAFIAAGLVTKQGDRISDWTAMPHGDGGSAAVVLKEPGDAAIRTRVDRLLKRLAADPSNGIERIFEPTEIARFGGWPRASFWVDMKTNFSIVQTGPQVRAGNVAGAHGYAPSHAEMTASFFIAGPGVRAGWELGEIDMRSVAPTLARAMGLRMPSADLPALEVFQRP